MSAASKAFDFFPLKTGKKKQARERDRQKTRERARARARDGWKKESRQQQRAAAADRGCIEAEYRRNRGCIGPS